ncbi:antiviral reverse transcriptase Drt2 [Acinetobacter sp. c2-A9]
MNSLDLHDFFTKRSKLKNYLHFDRKPNISNIVSFVTDPFNIEHHAFFPFISYMTQETKIKTEAQNGKLGFLKLPPKDRLINYSSHIDSAIYAYYATILYKHYECYLKNQGLSDSIIAFRKISKVIHGKKTSFCNIHFSKQVFDIIKDRKNCTVLCFDITKFFDNLDHEVLKQQWCQVLDVERLPQDHFKVYKSLTKFAYVDKKDLYQKLGLSLRSRTLHKRMDRLCSVNDFREIVRKGNLIKVNQNQGIPQGSPMSGLLSNIYMMNFDKVIFDFCQKNNAHYFRYCDDMIVISCHKLADEVERLVINEIQKLSLNINPAKTQKIIFNDLKIQITGKSTFNQPTRLQYLGIEFDGENVFVRDKGLSRHRYKMRKAIRMRGNHYRRLKANNQLSKNGIFERKLYVRYTYIGRRNYPKYVYRVSENFNSYTVRKQIKNHWNEFHSYLNK